MNNPRSKRPTKAELQAQRKLIQQLSVEDCDEIFQKHLRAFLKDSIRPRAEP
jgi:hypothetical protein